MISSGGVYAANIQSLDSIRTAAQEHAREVYNQSNGDVQVTPSRLDKRLRLANCSQELSTKHSSVARGGRLTVNVSCDGNKPWNLYVPVQIEIMQEVVVLTHSLPRKSVITNKDVQLEIRDTNKMHAGYFAELTDVVGKTLLRSTSGGLALTPMYVQAENLVKRGQEVTLLAQGTGITVRMSGEALANGIAGERIKVKNLSSNRVIEGIITENGQIKISL